MELNLFCPFYDENQWALSPQNTVNNVNNLGAVARTNVYTLDGNGGLLGVHAALVRKLVTELKDFDNVYYEICNEPYFGGVTMAWQHHIADVIAETEKNFRHQHLISQNIANGKAQITDPHPAVSIFNFHYASPPNTVAMNLGLQKVIGDNETGFKGTNDTHYRMEAWEFILAGGALYNNLDYSFTVGHEGGTFVYPKTQPGGGNPAFRTQMKVLKDFIHSFDFIRMQPIMEPAFDGRPGPDGVRMRGLEESGNQYAFYLFAGRPVKSSPLEISIPAGTYRTEWVNTFTGEIEKRESVAHGGGVIKFISPRYEQDIALRVRRR